MTRFVLLAALLAAPLALQAQTSASDLAQDHYAIAFDRIAHIDFDGARAHLDAAIEADPSFARAHLHRARLSPDAEQEAHLQHARSGRASAVDLRMIEAFEAHRADDHDRETEILTALHEQHPGDGEVSQWLGVHLYFMERYDDAAAILRHTANADPTNAAARNMLGYALMEAGDADGAEQAFLGYIRLAPHEANPYDSYGEFLLEEGRLDEAEVQFHKALARDPDMAASQRHLVRIAMERSDLRFRQALAGGDADAIAALYVENAVVLPPGAPAIRGRDAIRDHFAGMMAAGVDDVEFETVEMAHFDDTALRRTEITVLAAGQVVDRVKAMEVWRLDDGEWLYARDMYSSNGEAATAGTQ